MRRLHFFIALVLMTSVLMLGGCGGTGSEIKGVNLGFGGIVPVDENGDISIIKDGEMTAVASVVYSGEGTIKGEWDIDGEITDVTMDLPVQGEIDEGDNPYSTLSIESQLPADTLGKHEVSFTLLSPEKIETNAIEYTVDDAPPPANADEYQVSMRLGNGYCVTSAESAIRGNHELALAISVAYIKGQNDTRVLLEGDAGKIYPEGQDIDIEEGESFSWYKPVGGPWSTDAGDKLNIKAHLYERDGGGFIQAVLNYAAGFNVTGGDDYIGSVTQDIQLDLVANTPGNPNGTVHTVPYTFTGAPTVDGEKVFLMDFCNGQLGHIILELIVRVN